MKENETSAGFALIASLLFLIVLTVLGVSSMSTVGLQERMAANLKEKERASEAAEVAARGAEFYLATYSNVLEEFPDAKSSRATNSEAPKVWTFDGPLPTADKSKTLVEKTRALATNDSIWVNAVTSIAPPFDDNDLIGTGVTVDEETSVSVSEKYAAKPQSFTEEVPELFQPEGNSLDPDVRAKGKGAFYYRVTGRGVGGNVTAVSVVQSMYSRRFK